MKMLFLGDYSNGNLYQFELNENRKALSLRDAITDHIANTLKELEQVIFGGFN
jgi:hypothetical protein